MSALPSAFSICTPFVPVSAVGEFRAAPRASGARARKAAAPFPAQSAMRGAGGASTVRAVMSAPSARAASADASTTMRANIAALQAACADAPGTVMLELLAFRGRGIRSPRDDAVVVNKRGKTASFSILRHVALRARGRIAEEEAREALRLYAEVAEEAARYPGMHPNVDLLFRVLQGGLEYVVKIDGQYAAELE